MDRNFLVAIFLCQLNCEQEFPSEEQPNFKLKVWNRDLSKDSTHRKEMFQNL